MIPVGPIENGSTLASLLISIVSGDSETYSKRMQDKNQKRLIERIKHDRKCFERDAFGSMVKGEEQRKITFFRFIW